MYSHLHPQLWREIFQTVEAFSRIHGLRPFRPENLTQAPVPFAEIVTTLLCFGCDVWPEGTDEPKPQLESGSEKVEVKIANSCAVTG